MGINAEDPAPRLGGSYIGLGLGVSRSPTVMEGDSAYRWRSSPASRASPSSLVLNWINGDPCVGSVRQLARACRARASPWRPAATEIKPGHHHPRWTRQLSSVNCFGGTVCYYLTSSRRGLVVSPKLLRRVCQRCLSRKLPYHRIF
jgi:hypothetical protein